MKAVAKITQVIQYRYTEKNIFNMEAEAGFSHLNFFS